MSELRSVSSEYTNMMMMMMYGSNYTGSIFCGFVVQSAVQQIDNKSNQRSSSL